MTVSLYCFRYPHHSDGNLLVCTSKYLLCDSPCRSYISSRPVWITGSRVPQSVLCLATDWKTGRLGSIPCRGFFL
jgi:hypothetical protein